MTKRLVVFDVQADVGHRPLEGPKRFPTDWIEGELALTLPGESLEGDDVQDYTMVAEYLEQLSEKVYVAAQVMRGAAALDAAIKLQQDTGSMISLETGDD